MTSTKPSRFKFSVFGSKSKKGQQQQQPPTSQQPSLNDTHDVLPPLRVNLQPRNPRFSRGVASSKSGTSRDSTEGPLTPEDDHDPRASYQHSLMTLTDDPFAATFPPKRHSNHSEQSIGMRILSKIEGSPGRKRANSKGMTLLPRLRSPSSKQRSEVTSRPSSTVELDLPSPSPTSPFDTSLFPRPPPLPPRLTISPNVSSTHLHPHVASSRSSSSRSPSRTPSNLSLKVPPSLTAKTDLGDVLGITLSRMEEDIRYDDALGLEKHHVI